ncbi:hypothetical protein AAMO2058_001437600 [Amorphochlora amoebiformis]
MLAARPKTWAASRLMPSVFAAQKLQFHSTTPMREWSLDDYKVGGRCSQSGITATVFGCSGFLGPRVVHNLGKIGSRVVTPYRGDGMNIRHLKMMGDLGQIAHVPFHIRDQASVDKAVEKSSVVVNCIGNTFETRNFTFQQTYLDTTKALVEACQKAGVDRIINISSVNAALDSESPWLRANAEADEYLHSNFPNATTIKVTRMFGPMDKFVNQYASLGTKAPITPLIDHGDHLIQPVYVNDVGNAVAAAVLNPESVGKEYYLGGPDVYKMKEFIEELHEKLYLKSSNAYPVSMRLARLFGYIVQQFRFPLNAFAVISEDQIIQLQYDNVAPTKQLGFKDLGITKLQPLKGKFLEGLCIVHRARRSLEDTHRRVATKQPVNQSTIMSTTVKIVFKKDTRRVVLPQQAPFKNLEEIIDNFYPNRFPNGVHLRYLDDEKDYVTVTCDQELLDAVELSASTLKLYLSANTESDSDSDFVKVSRDGQRSGLLNNLPKPEPEQPKTVQPEEVKEAKEVAEQAEATKQEVERELSKATKKAAKEAKNADVKKAEKKEAKKTEKKEAKTAKKEAKKAKKEAKKAEKEAIKAEKEAKKADKEAKKEARKAEKLFKKEFLSKLNCRFLKDVTVPDEQEVELGSKLEKIWLVKNDGKVAWPEGIKLVKFGKGTVESVQDCQVPLLQPGEDGRIVVTCEVPNRVGKFKSQNYSLSFDGKKFGDRFWIVVRATKKAAKAEVKSKSKIPQGKAPRKAALKPKKTKNLGAHFVKDLNFPDDSVVAPGQVIEKEWLIKNSGEVSWPKDTKLVSIEGSTFGVDVTVDIKELVQVGDIYKLRVRLVAPTKTGKHTAKFMLSSNGQTFGHKYWVNVCVSKFPNKTQLMELAKEFVSDPSVVGILQSELPFILKDLRNGKKLVTIVDALVKKEPHLMDHTFMVFIRPFLHSAESFMNMQLEIAIGMYSIWAMTPFSPGATQKDEKKAEVPEWKPKAPEKKPVNDEKATPMKPKVNGKHQEKQLEDVESVKPVVDDFGYPMQVKTLMDMGFQNLEAIKPLLIKHKGNTQAVLAELFN